jgi:hypothetical protein
LALWAGLVALLAGYCWLVGRTTVYTVTDRRLVMRVGVAVPISLNLPFTKIEHAGVRLFADGTADLPVTVKPGNRVAYLVLWPHAVPWRMARPQPMLRSVPDGARVAEILGGALARAEAEALTEGRGAAPAIAKSAAGAGAGAEKAPAPSRPDREATEDGPLPARAGDPMAAE